MKIELIWVKEVPEKDDDSINHFEYSTNKHRLQVDIQGPTELAMFISDLIRKGMSENKAVGWVEL